MTKREQLEKNVVDTAAASATYAYYAADDTAWTAYRKALQELEDYLKEQDK